MLLAVVHISVLEVSHTCDTFEWQFTSHGHSVSRFQVNQVVPEGRQVHNGARAVGSRFTS